MCPNFKIFSQKTEFLHIIYYTAPERRRKYTHFTKPYKR